MFTLIPPTDLPAIASRLTLCRSWDRGRREGFSPNAEAVRLEVEAISKHTKSLLLFFGMLFQPIWTLLYTLFPFFLGRSHPSLPPAVRLVSVIFPGPLLFVIDSRFLPFIISLKDFFSPQLEEFKKEKQITKKTIKAFVCFHAGGLRSQIYLTRSPHPYVDRQSFCLLCYSHYLLAGIHHTALLIPSHSVSISPFFLGTILISSSSFWPQVFVGD